MILNTHHHSKDLLTDNSISILKEHLENTSIVLFFSGYINTKTQKIDKIKYLGESISKQISFEKIDFLIMSSPNNILRKNHNHQIILEHLQPFQTGLVFIDHLCENINILKESKKIIQKKINKNEILNYFSIDGPLSQFNKNYEKRESQIIMTEETLESFNNNHFYVCEAPTGTGKSISYLLNAIYYSKINNEKVIISTNTIGLQEQLFYKDIPFMKKIIPFDFQHSMIKGKNNFFCQKRWETLHLTINSHEHIDEINYLKKWIQTNKTGDKSDLKHPISSELWNEINVDGQLCRPNKCVHAESCHYIKKKETDLKSNILIVNHHILCADTYIKNKIDSTSPHSIIPNYNTLIIDEAHNLEETARSYFTSNVSNIMIQKNINKIIQFDKKKYSGILKEIEEKIKSPRVEYLSLVELSIKSIKNYNKVNKYYTEIYEFINKNNTKKLKEQHIRIKNEFFSHDSWQSNCFEKLSIIQDKLILMIEQLTKIKNWLNDQNEVINITNEYQLLEVFINRLEEILHIFNLFFEQENDEDFVRFIHINSFNQQIFLSLNIVPLDISQLLHQSLFSNIQRALITSATLCSNNQFNFFLKQTGLHLINNLKTKQLPSNFDYKKNVQFIIPSDIAPPTSSEHSDDIAKYITQLSIISKGKTLALFTSFSQLNHVYDIIYDILSQRGIKVLKQGETPKHILIEEFKNNDAVLLGVNSFWEGIDLKGDVLKNLIMTKLPFNVPNDPFYEAKIEQLEKENRNAFIEYSVPLAIVRFKQGFGRLIRSSKDNGVFCVLDNRLLHKRYGTYFLKSIPSMKIKKSIEELNL